MDGDEFKEGVCKKVQKIVGSNGKVHLITWNSHGLSF